jgi:hypothetical protein
MMHPALPRSTGTNADHFMQCPACSEWFDMRDLTQVAERVHDGSEIGFLKNPELPLRGACTKRPDSV